MAGMLIHLAMGNRDKMGDPEHLTSENRAYVIGLLLPDIAKLGLIKTKEDFDRFFSGCEEKDILSYEEYIEYCKDPHFTGDSKQSRNPDLRAFVKLHLKDLKKPIWQGVFCHLVGDKAFYRNDSCINLSKIDDDFEKEGLSNKQWMESKTANYIYGKDGDYNLINQFIENEFHVLKFLSPELIEKCNVQFSDAEKEPKYMNINEIKKCICLSRVLNKHFENGDVERVLNYFDYLEEEKKAASKSQIELLERILPAVQFYEGDTNNSFLPEELFDEKTRKAPKADVTLNMLLDDDTAEKQRFLEGKLQTPGLITPEGVKKMLEIYEGFYQFCLQNPIDYNVNLCAMKRCSELDSPFIRSLTSTTKHSPGKIYKQGYGDKVGLALCYYKLHKGALAFDYEKLGELYAKKQEREVLLMPGNKWNIRHIGQDKKYCGRDGNPAEVFEIDVCAPDFSKIIKNESNGGEDIVFDSQRLDLVRNILQEMNNNIGGDFKNLPDEYWEWKHAFQQKAYSLLRNINLSYKNEQRNKKSRERQMLSF